MTAKVYSSPRALPPSPLSLVERELVCVVLEDCVDQLAVLGGIMPSSYVEKPSAVDNVMGSELRGILETQRQLESRFDQLRIEGGGGEGRAAYLKDNAHSLAATTQAARSARAVQENLQKLQRDREGLQHMVEETLVEVASEGTFTTLSSHLTRCHQEKLNMEHAILREEECRKRVKQLKRQLMEVRREKEEELNHLNEQIAHLKDQLQELKAKTNLEAKYIRKETQVRVEVGQRRHANKELELTEDERRLRQQLEEEKMVSGRIEQYLKKHYEELGNQVDHWMSKHEQDVEMKSRDLLDIKQAKSTGLQELDELTKRYREYEEVVVDHRAMKERQRLKAEQEERERKAITLLQRWWRRVMVRKGLGPFKKGKKGKKGKGKGKGKGKKGKKGKKKKA